MSHRVYILARWIRVWHWTNATLIILLLASGVSMHYSQPTVRLINFSLAREIHNFAGIMLCLNYGFFFIGNIVSGNWWQFIPRPHGYAHRAWKQIRYYLWGIFRGEPHPFPTTVADNFNPLQQFTYWGVMYVLVPLLMLTGVVYLFPTLAPDRWFGVDGLLPIALAHYVVAFLIFLFFLVHVYLTTTGEKLTDHVKMMITGWHEE
jgi:thiosulfate reductase cytochrome b subunit